ncbi:hypothetical protein [Isachenkonia alkalipeptolytica]|uniref:hypothetical protein n=1 Tax=Isachenkonia alkalipeptolytica TaxID=2565777 RepID=UPI00191C11CC|nr:hypothetical protein [Isachenkonia alkalipeptolytica]
MAKKAASWRKPEGKEGLIGVKKVDDSVFKYGIDIPMSFWKEFKEANGMQDVEEGKAEKIKLIFEDTVFGAELRSVRDWGDCDDFCTHALGALISQHNHLFDRVVTYSHHL